jgi:L-threonylcarbamoyladenylate synthase
MISEKTIRKAELLANVQFYEKKLKEGIFIIPTDTVYGLSCNAKSPKLVENLRKIKKSKQPFSVIAPSKKWIYENCVITKDAKKWIAKLPGPYTLILKLKNKRAVAKSVYNADNCSLGVRIPDHWSSKIVARLKFPLISTLANVSGEDYMKSLDDLDLKIKNKVNLIVSVGKKRGHPSTIINLVENKVIKR